jgi:DNA phosphorothioation-associated DGQHR protein 1
MPFIEAYALKVVQPLGEFYLTAFPADKLLQVAFAEELMYIDATGKQKGNQRKKDPNRLKEITRYIDSVEMAFPNSIILGANYTEDGNVLEQPEEEDNNDVDKLRWKVEQIDEELYKIVVPTSEKLASIIDGQHRVLAFKDAKLERKVVNLPCAVFFDLPNSYQAFLFATINGNQKAVNRSLALEQFGFNVDEEPEKSWTPEKLAVYLSRKLNMKLDSPFYRRIKIAPLDPKRLFANKTDWFVSMATVVDGILSLISSKPKRDRVEMAQEKIFGGRSRNMVKDYSDHAPLRNWFLENRDDDIYQTVKRFFEVVNTTLWEAALPGSYIIKTVGVLALFDLLKRILQENPDERDFKQYLTSIKNVDFSDDLFQASGVGRSRIRATLLMANNFEVRSTHETRRSIERLLNAE